MLRSLARLPCRRAQAFRQQPGSTCSRRLLSTDGTLASADAEASLFTPPRVDPELKVTANADDLPDDIRRAIREHTAHATLPSTHGKNIVLRWKLDSRRSLTKRKKRALRRELFLSPFVLLGAHRRLVERAEAYLRGAAQSEAQTRGATLLLQGELPFRWLETAAGAVRSNHSQSEHALNFSVKASRSPHEYCKLMVIQESLAMLAQPQLDPILPPHAWSRRGQARSTADPVAALRRLVRASDDGVHYKTTVAWDFRDELAFRQTQLAMLTNMLEPYISIWWTNMLHVLFNEYAQGRGTKKTRTWKIFGGPNRIQEGPELFNVSHLPVFLTDLFFSRLDYAPILTHGRATYLRHQAQELRNSDPEKDALGLDEERVTHVPKKFEGAAMEMHRVGPILEMRFRGVPLEREKMTKGIMFELKSNLQLKKKEVEPAIARQQRPIKRKEAQHKRAVAPDAARAKLPREGERRGRVRLRHGKVGEKREKEHPRKRSET